jgi:molybdenum storage protein
MSENTPRIEGARHLASRLTAESLQDRELLRRTDAVAVRTLLPGITVVKVGGASILDRGPEALLPVIGELGALAAERPLLITVGEGARGRHVYGIAADLGLPTGMLAGLGSSIAEQNALIVRTLMMGHGAVAPPVGLLPIVLNGQPVVMSGMPPFGWWEPPPTSGRIPEYRTDAGTFLTAEVFGCANVIYVKDQDGLYDRDPAAHPDDAKLIPEIGVSELLARKLYDLPLDAIVLEMLTNARLVKQIQIVNGLRPGAITRAITGAPEGSVITAA